jgi:antirestriction protein
MLEIYITDLQSYNEGDLVGEWITLPLTDKDLANEISKVLHAGTAISNSNNHEEYFISDWNWQDVEFFTVEEYDNIFELNEKLQAIKDVDSYKHKPIAFLLSEGLASDLDDAISKADDVIVHENKTMEDVAYYLIQDCYNIHELSPIIANHIDYDGIARDLEYDGTYFEVGNDVFEYVG